jgi:predicted acetyltransferase
VRLVASLSDDESLRHGSVTARLRLRPLAMDDEAAFLRAHEVMAAEHFTFGLGYEPGMSWPAYLDALRAQRCGVVPPEGLVPATFLVADVGGEIVGRVSIRHELNEVLTHEGGHIGYGVLPQHRRRGYATEVLLQSLVIARAEGVNKVLVTCSDHNLGSAAVIERCGGVLESIVTSRDGESIRRYWIK